MVTSTAPARNFVLILRAEALGRCKLLEFTKKLRLHLASAKGFDLRHLASDMFF